MRRRDFKPKIGARGQDNRTPWLSAMYDDAEFASSRWKSRSLATCVQSQSSQGVARERMKVLNAHRVRAKARRRPLRSQPGLHRLQYMEHGSGDALSD
jgi:hypothetical protein